MIRTRQRLLWAGLLASAALASSGAFAQQTTAPSAVPGAEAPAVGNQAHGTHKRMDPAQRMERMKAFHAKRMAALKQKLQLTAAQEGAWDGFAAAQQPPVRDPAQMRANRAEMAKMTTPQRLDRMQARQTERSAMFAKRADATRTFYAGLTPEQQKTFDTASMMRFGPHGQHGPHRGHHAAPAKS